jgi:hypothetical protein
MQLEGYHADNLAKDFSQKYLFNKKINKNQQKLIFSFYLVMVF